jgi:hypothetical protein
MSGQATVRKVTCNPDEDRTSEREPEMGHSRDPRQESPTQSLMSEPLHPRLKDPRPPECSTSGVFDFHRGTGAWQRFSLSMTRRAIG